MKITIRYAFAVVVAFLMTISPSTGLTRAASTPTSSVAPTFKQILKIGNGAIQQIRLTEDGKFVLVDNGQQVIAYNLKLEQVAIFDAGGQTIVSIAFKAPQLALGAGDGSIHIWNIDDHSQSAVLTGHTVSVNSLDFSPDGSHLVSGSDDKTAVIWDIASQKPLFTLKGHQAVIQGVSYSSESGARILTYDNAYAIRVWDAKSGMLLSVIQAPVSMWRRIAYDSAKNFVVTNVLNSVGNQLTLYNVMKKSSTTLSTNYSSVPTDVRFSPDGTKLLTLSTFSGQATIINLKTLKPLQEFSFPQNSITYLAFSSDSKKLVFGLKTGEVSIEDLETGHEVRFKAYNTTFSDVSFQGTDKLVTASSDGKVTLWDMIGTSLATFDNGLDVRFLSSLAAGHFVVTNSAGRLTLLDAAKFTPLATLEGFAEGSSAIIWSPDGSRLASAGIDRIIHIWDTQTGKETLQLQGHTLSINRIAWSPDGKFIVSASSDETARLWDASTGKELFKFSSYTDRIFAVAFSSDSQRVAIGSRQASSALIIYKIDGTQIVNFSPQTPNTALSLAWMPNNPNVLVAGVADGTTLYVNLTAPVGAQVTALKAHTDEVFGLAWSPDGKHFVTGSFDNTIRIWTANGPAVQKVITQERSSGTLSWSNDGNFIAANFGNYIKILDSNGQQVALIAGHVGAVYSVAWSPNSQLLASTSADGTIRIWARN